MTKGRLKVLKSLSIFMLLSFSCNLFVSPKSHAIQCSSVIPLNSIAKINSPRSLSTLIEKMDTLGVRLELQHNMDLLNGTNDFFEIFAYDKENKVIGEISLTPEGIGLIINGTDRPLYTSHIDVTDSYGKDYAGSGLGTYLYAAAATAAFKLGAVLFSSTNPLAEAQSAWERMVKSNWAVKGHERDQYIIALKSGEAKPSTFRFRSDLLENGFFGVLESRIEDPDDVFLLFQ